MARVDYYRRRVPVPLQGTVIDGHKLAGVITIPLRNGMTRTRAMALTEDMILRAKARTNYRMTDAEAWALAMKVVDNHQPEDDFPTAPKELRLEERLMVDQWIMRIVNQKNGLWMVESLMREDDPEALTGHPPVIRPSAPAPTVKSIRSVAGRSPLHSDVTREYFASKPRPKNYRRALEQFREQCGDLEIHEYASDHVWAFRNWLDSTKDEKKGEPLAGKSKNNKLSAVSSLFSYSIEKRYRNENPVRDVKLFPKSENVKKRRRLYTPEELEALFVRAKRKAEWQKWSPLLALYAGVRLTESIQLRPNDVSKEFGVWHLIIRPGRGQSVKGGRARVVPVHKELVRLGLVDLAKRAKKERREWLFKDVPLVAKPGKEFNAPDVETIIVPSQNAATQWFGRYCDDHGVTDPNVDFHALRGAFVTYGSQMGSSLSLRMQIVGHSKGSDVHNTYIYAGASLKALKAEIDQIEYPIRIPRSP